MTRLAPAFTFPPHSAMMNYFHPLIMKYFLSLIVGISAFATLSGQAAAAAPLTRAEFVEAVVQEVFPNDTYDCFRDITSPRSASYTLLFADVRKTDPHAMALCIGIHNGIIDGDRSANFRPNALINTAEASKILALAYGVALPDSVAIRVLPWHWRYTEAFKRLGVLPRGFNAYGQLVTRTDLSDMFTNLTRMKPRVLFRQPTTAPTTVAPAQRIRIVTPTTPQRAATRSRTVGNYHMRLMKSFNQPRTSPRPST